MSEENKIIEFPGKNQKDEQDEALQIPDAIQQELKQYDQWINEFVMVIDKAIIEYAKNQQEKRDISLPLEALIRVFSLTSEDLDRQIHPDELQKHIDMRVDLANKINETITRFMNVQILPVYQQDIFTALSYVIISYLYQNRVYALTMKYNESAGGKDEDQITTE